MVDTIRPAHMSSKDSKPGSTRSRTIFKKRNGAYVVACSEDGVTRVYRLHVVKSNPRENFVAEPDRARAVLVAATTHMATTTGLAATTGVAANTDMATITDAAATTGVAATFGVAADALELPDVTSAIAEYARSMQLRPLKDPLAR